MRGREREREAQEVGGEYTVFRTTHNAIIVLQVLNKSRALSAECLLGLTALSAECTQVRKICRALSAECTRSARCSVHSAIKVHSLCVFSCLM